MNFGNKVSNILVAIPKIFINFVLSNSAHLILIPSAYEINQYFIKAREQRCNEAPSNLISICASAHLMRQKAW